MASKVKPLKEKIAGDASKSEVTRQRIVDAAARVFAQRGYAHTRLTDIAAEAKSHAGGIYYYFSSREQLVQELLKTSTKRTIDAINARLEALPEGASTLDRLRAAVTAQITEVVAHDSYSAAFLKIYSQVPEEIKIEHRPVLREFFEIWRRIIRQGQAAGEIRTDIDPAVMRLAIVGSIQWSAEWADQNTSSPEKLAEQMAALFFGGLVNNAS